MKTGDHVRIGASEGVICEVDRHGIVIHWPKAFGWANGYTVRYTRNELKKYNITVQEETESA